MGVSYIEDVLFVLADVEGPCFIAMAVWIIYNRQ